MYRAPVNEKGISVIIVAVTLLRKLASQKPTHIRIALEPADQVSLCQVHLIDIGKQVCMARQNRARPQIELEALDQHDPLLLAADRAQDHTPQIGALDLL